MDTSYQTRQGKQCHEYNLEDYIFHWNLYFLGNLNSTIHTPYKWIYLSLLYSAHALPNASVNWVAAQFLGILLESRPNTFPYWLSKVLQYQIILLLLYQFKHTTETRSPIITTKWKKIKDMLLPNFVFTLIGYATLTQLSITFDNLKWQRADCYMLQLKTLKL